MTAPNTYEAIHRLLATKGIDVLHKGQAPANPFNLLTRWWLRVAESPLRWTTRSLRRCATWGATPVANHSGRLAISALGNIV